MQFGHVFLIGFDEGAVLEEAVLVGGGEGAAVVEVETGWGRGYLRLYFAKLVCLRWLLRWRGAEGTAMRETSLSSSCLDGVELILLLLCGIDIRK
jgi:hypothetical protein